MINMPKQNKDSRTIRTSNDTLRKILQVKRALMKKDNKCRSANIPLTSSLKPALVSIKALNPHKNSEHMHAYMRILLRLILARRKP